MNKHLFEILDKNIKDEDIDWLYGGGEYIVTKEDIEALLKGQKLQIHRNRTNRRIPTNSKSKD